MPDYDPKNIPILDDIIEDESDETAAIHEKIIVTDEMHNDDNTLDLFNDESNILEIDDTEPRIGAIDKFIDDDVTVNIETAEDEIADDEAPADNNNDNDNDGDESDNETADESITFESALIDYSHQDSAENNFTPQTQDDISIEQTDADDEQTFDQPSDQPSDQPADISEPYVISNAAAALNIDAIIDDVVTQLIPELEQQLRTRLRQALQEQAYKQTKIISTDERK